MTDLKKDDPGQNPDKSSEKWDRLESLGEGPNPISDANWRYQLFLFFLGLLAAGAVFLCVWNGLLGFPILLRFGTRPLSLGSALFSLAILAGAGIIFYFLTKPNE